MPDDYARGQMNEIRPAVRREKGNEKEKKKVKKKNQERNKHGGKERVRQS